MGKKQGSEEKRKESFLSLFSLVNQKQRVFLLFCILLSLSRVDKGKGEEKCLELFFLFCLAYVWKEKKGWVPKALMLPFSCVFFMCVFHECSIASCISIFPILSLIHFINEEIVLVDDQIFYFYYFNWFTWYYYLFNVLSLVYICVD